MDAPRFKRYGTGIIYLVGNGRVTYFDAEKIKEMHALIHEWERNPEELTGRTGVRKTW